MADRIDDLGGWLYESLAEAEGREAMWLLALGDFDAAGAWASDGQLSCAEWLTWRCRMSRSCAYEKLQVARQLRVRPALARAFEEGRISYSACRAIARMIDPDPAVDEAVIALAESASVRDVERVVGAYCRHRDQHRRPRDAQPNRNVRARPNLDGTTTIQFTVTDLEAEEFMSIVDAFMAEDTDDDCDQSTRVDSEPSVSWATRQADAVMDMARTALAHARDGQAAGDDRYMVHLIAHGDQLTTVDGTPLDPAHAARLRCDASAVKLLLGPGWEPLAIGRRTRVWNTAQRRAARVRDGGTCRFPGCTRRRVDLHHHQWWTRGGTTDISNGFLACDRHHTLIHSGFEVTGDANAELVFHRPDGTVIGTTSPRLRRSPVPTLS